MVQPVAIGTRFASGDRVVLAGPAESSAHRVETFAPGGFVENGSTPHADDLGYLSAEAVVAGAIAGMDRGTAACGHVARTRSCEALGLSHEPDHAIRLRTLLVQPVGVGRCPAND